MRVLAVLITCLPAALAAACPTVRSPTAVRHPADIDELSGLAHSRRNPGIIYAHNDGGAARVFAFNQTGQMRAILNLQSVTALDWEDLSIGMVDGRELPYLHVADSGNNDLQRATLVIHRFPEPVVPATGLTNMFVSGRETFVFRYPNDAKYDAEGMAWDQHTQTYYLATRSRPGQPNHTRIYRGRPTATGQTLTLEFLAAVNDLGDNHKTKAADFDPRGRFVLLQHSNDTSSTRIMSWVIAPGANIAQRLATTPCVLTLANYSQAEGVTFSADGNFLLVGGENPGATNPDPVRIYPWSHPPQETSTTR